jgi:hypothetical protein
MLNTRSYKTPYGRGQFGQSDRLNEVDIETACCYLDLIFNPATSSQGYQWYSPLNACVLFTFADFAGEEKSIFDRHFNVGDDCVGTLTVELSEASLRRTFGGNPCSKES